MGSAEDHNRGRRGVGGPGTPGEKSESLVSSSLVPSSLSLSSSMTWWTGTSGDVELEMRCCSRCSNST